MESQSKAMEVVEECKQELSEALTLRGQADAKKETVVETQKYGLGIQEIINGLKEGIYENPKEVKKHITDVCVLFESLGAEEALVKTLPQILRRKPEERGSFDDMALQQLGVYLNNHLSSLSSNIEAADAIVAEHAVAATAWEAAVEVSEDKKKESDDALQAAQAEQERLQEALTCARKVLKEHTSVVKSRDSDLATEQVGLHGVEEVLEALEFLREYVTPAPVLEEVNEPEELPAESAVEMKVDEVQSKSKESDAHMNLGDVPSPTRSSRPSLGAEAPAVVA